MFRFGKCMFEFPQIRVIMHDTYYRDMLKKGSKIIGRYRSILSKSLLGRMAMF